MRFVFSLLALSILIAACAEKRHTPPPLNAERAPALKEFVKSHRASPVAYVTGKFADHDVVIIGEMHRIRENVLLIQELVPAVYAHGVHVLATEFARREDQALIDSLIFGKSYNERLAREITFQQLPFWGFQEYVDIFKAAWQLNQSLPDSAPRFRILAMNDSPDWSIMKTREDRDSDSLKRLVWRGGGEHLWAKVVTAAVASGEKVLAYCGMHHAFSGYHQPIVVDGKFIRFDSTRTGNNIKRALGDRVMTIYLHALWPPRSGYGGEQVYPAAGQIDALFADLGAEYYPIGFDLKNTPLGQLQGADAVYSQGYSDFTLSQFADGWIFQCPLGQYHGVTPIANFINEENVAEARMQSPSPGLRSLSVAELNQVIAKDAAQKSWLGKFQ